MTYFNTPNQLVEFLQWTIAIAKLQHTQEQVRLRTCCLEHARWLEETSN